MTNDLAAAISRDEFALHYEPQLEFCTGRTVGMQAVLRWHHPTRGLLMPPAFHAIAERSGASAAIGRWMIDRACEQMSLWRKAGNAPATVAVNISFAQIKNGDDFVQFVSETLAKWGVAPGELELDVTESMLAQAAMAQNDALEQLQKLGVRISIDDFGTKCSTFDYLSYLSGEPHQDFAAADRRRNERRRQRSHDAGHRRHGQRTAYRRHCARPRHEFIKDAGLTAVSTPAGGLARRGQRRLRRQSRVPIMPSTNQFMARMSASARTSPAATRRSPC
jgi:hypothetical protein